MANIILLNKPFNVLSQFTQNSNDGSKEQATLKPLLPNYPGFYVAGRLDYDSEGLLLLTDNGALQHHISDPKHKQPKTYWAQVEGDISDTALTQLRQGVKLKDGTTRPAKAKRLNDNIEQQLWLRNPPIRERKNIPTSWLELTIREGKNRQVRRMTAAVGFPTLRLIRMSIGDWHIADMQPGEHRLEQVSLPEATTKAPPKRKHPPTNKPGTRRTNNRQYNARTKR